MFYSPGSATRWVKVFFASAALIAFACASSMAITSSYYGGDLDTYSMLSSFLGVLHGGVYVPSRFTGYPVAEFGIGFLAWLGGSSLSNIVTFLLYVASVIIFPFCLQKQPSFGVYLAFVALAITSPVLVFDNIQSMDYSWGLFFWVAGTFALVRFGSKELFIIFNALAIGSRPSFALFAAASLYGFASFGGALSVKSGLQDWRPILLFTTFFSGGLFYLPNWLIHRFSLSWIAAASSDFMGAHGLLARIFYKGLLSIGFAQSCLLILAFAWLGLKLVRSISLIRLRYLISEFCKQNRFLLLVVIFNLCIFVKIPHEVSYLQPGLLAFYWLLCAFFSSSCVWILVSLVILNLLNWFVEPQILDITYRDASLCGAKQAIAAKPSRSLKPGRIHQYLEVEKKKLSCYSPGFQSLGGADLVDAVSRGMPLRLANPDLNK